MEAWRFGDDALRKERGTFASRWSAISCLLKRPNNLNLPGLLMEVADDPDTRRESPNNFHQSRKFFLGLLQLRVFRLSSNEDGDVGVGVFPEREEILIGSTRFDVVARQGIGPAQLKMRE
jgi:hypothetical protein